MTKGWTPTSQFTTDGGLIAAEEIGNALLPVTGSMQRIQLIPLRSGKVCHTVEGVEVERRPFYRTLMRNVSGKGLSATLRAPSLYAFQS